MSKIQKILAEAGFPNTPEGRAAFYKKFPNKEDWENFQKMKEGGNLSGAPHNGQPTADEFFNFGDPTFGNLNIPYGNFAYGGYFAPGGINNPNAPVLKEEPKGATKVSTVDPGYNMLGSVGSKTFYDKKADKAINSPGSGSGVSDDWKQSMISRLQSGVSPQSLADAGHISKNAVKDFEQYYKPVYTEAGQQSVTNNTSATPSTPSMPLKDQDKIDRKQFWNPGNQNKYYDSFQYPDVNSGYTNPTNRYFDKTTGQEIDPLKSFTDKGDYAANFIQGAPGAQGTLKQTRVNTPVGSSTDNPITVAGSSGFAYGGYMDEGGDVASPTNYGAFPNTQYGGLLDQSNNQDYPVFETGGNEFEKGGSFYQMINNLKKLKKKAFSKGGDTTMQGGNETDYPAKVRGEFDNAIKTNLHNSLVEEAGNDVLGMYKQMGGPQFNQMNPDNQAYQQMLQNNINQGQSGLNQAANNLFDASMDLSRSYGVKNKVKVKAQKGVNVDPGFEIDPDTNKPMTREKSEEIRNKKAKREKLLEEMLTAYEQRGQAQPNYNYGNYPAEQYGYPAHYYNQGYGMRHFPMNYGYTNKISASDIEALKNLAKNPSSNLKDFSHRQFGPWSKTKMTFGYKDQTPFTENKGDSIQVNLKNQLQKGFTEGFPAVHTVEDMPERRAADLKNKLQSLPIARNNYKDMDYDEYLNNTLNPSFPKYNAPVQETYNPGFKDMSYDDQFNYISNPYLPSANVPPVKLSTSDYLKPGMPEYDDRNSAANNIEKEKYGGLLKAQVGIQSATGNLGVSANPIFMGNSFEPIGNAPGAAPSNISYQGATTPAYSTPESVGLQNKNIEMKGMGTNEKQVSITNKQKPKFNQQAMANWEIAGANMLASGLEQRDVAANTAKLKASRVADKAFLPTPENAISIGGYDPNLGTFRNNKHVPVQFHGQSVVKYGGYMQDGGIPQQDNKEQQIMAGVAQMLQQGAESEQILQQLVEMGLPEEQASQIIETVIDQLQMNEQSAQEQPQQEMAPAMKYGGYFDGGMYEEGQELDLSPEEIEELKAQGYELDELD